MPLPIPKTKHGSSTSPIVANGLVILNLDQQGRWFKNEENKWKSESHSYVMAVDGATGEVVWKQSREAIRATYSVPLLWENGDHHEVLVQGRARLDAYSLLDGTRIWWCNELPPTASSTPVIGNGQLYLAAQDSFGEPDNVVTLPDFDHFLEAHDENHDGRISKAEVPNDFAVINRGRGDRAGNSSLRRWFPDRNDDGAINQQEWVRLTKTLRDLKPKFQQGALAIRLGGSGNVTETHISWRHTKGIPEVPSPLFYQNRVYYVKNGGIVFCRNAESGSVTFTGRLGPSSHFYSSPVVAHGNIYSASESGVVVVFEAGDSLRVLARSDLGERIMATLAFVDGKIYVRTDSHLWAFGG